MEKKVVFTNGAPAAIGPYSQGIVAGDFLFTSGQLPINPATGDVIVGDIKKATAQCIENIKAIAEAAGCTLGDVVKATLFITDMNQFAQINEVYSTYFNKDCPSRSCVEVSKMAKGAEIEIEAIILLKK